MTPTTPPDLIATLGEIRELSPDVRFGQLLANLGFLAEDRVERTLWGVEDAQLLDVMKGHRDDLLRRDR